MLNNDNHQSSDEEEDVYSDDEGAVRVDGIYIPPPTKPYCNTEIKGPRLVITQIENHFFKSYAEKQILGPFHKCFNAIVGPNGSGKSNVIDSMLFVFGYRASKIRSKKLSVLIHNSSQHNNVQSCTVAVHFGLIVDEENDSGEIIPGSEFVVSRTAFKDNSSFYQLNGNKVHFKEIAVILRKHGIDLDHNRFLILQGEVEQISMMKPKAANEHETGMLEYLEDIIGTTRFKKPLSQLEERVELLSEQRSDKLNRLKLIENQIEELNEPMEEAVQFLKLENDIAMCNNLIYQRKLYDLKDIENKKQNIVEECKEKQSEFIQQLKLVQDEQKTKEEILKETSTKYNTLKSRAEASTKALEKANKKDIELKDEMIITNENRKKNMQLLTAAQKKLVTNEKIPEKNKELLMACQEKLIKLNKDREKFEEEKIKTQESLKDETVDLQKERELIQSELNNLKKAVHETEAAYKIANSELTLYTESHVKAKETLNTLEHDIAETNILLTQRMEDVKNLKKKIPLTEKSLQDAHEEIKSVKIQEAQLIEATNKNRMQLEDARNSMNASKSKSKVLDALLQQKREGNCPGLYGRLGDLGAIDLKFDVAISTACGPLDHLVVDTVETAKWCIEFLKQHNIGRIAIIALEKQQHFWGQINKHLQTPENVARLFDLIRVENEELKPAFYYGLRDTLVAKDLDQAVRVAYGAQRFRVVTLRGDLIEVTGTMSGGGNKVSKGRMGQSIATTQVQPKDLELMHSNIEEMEGKLRHLHSKQSSLENQIHALETELNSMKTNLKKYNMEVQALQKQLSALKSKLDKQKTLVSTSKTDPKELKKLTNIVDLKKEAYDVALANTTELQTKVDKIANEIKEKTTSKLQNITSKIKDVVESITKIEDEVTKLEVAIRTAERNVIKSKTTITRLEEEIMVAEESLREKQEKRREIEDDGKQLLECVNNINNQLDQMNEEYDDIKKVVNDLKQKQNAIKSEKIEIDEKLKSAQEKLSDVKAHAHQWNVKISQLKLHEIPYQGAENLKTLSHDEISTIELENVQRDLHVHEDNIKRLKPNLSIIEEFKKKREFYIEKSNELVELTNKRKKMKDLHENLKLRRKTEFLNGYNIIKMKLKEMYQMITLGGDADFELVDSFDPFSEGILLNVRPPKKTWKVISNLSGGEKTLTSLALVFALHYYKPSPLYVMDEIDAALDFKNVSIVANYIKDRTKNAQFIIISLRNYMFELCDHLVGIYKTYNTTKTITINPKLVEGTENIDPNME